MTEQDARRPADGLPGMGDQRLVYVLPQDVMHTGAEDEIDLLALWKTLWKAKWLIVGITSVFILSAVIYALCATEWYRAEVLLAPAEEKSSLGLGAQFGGLASLAGISVGGGGSAEPVALLQSRGFTRGFIEDEGLLPVLLADDWDAANQRWKDKDPSDWPDVRDAVKYFDENVRSVQEDRKTGLVTLGVEWTDPEIAAAWANLLVKRLNDQMRDWALREAKANVTYLQAEMGATSVVTLQQSIGRLLEAELQKLMMARGNEEFSFRVVDRAEAPKLRSRPKRTLIVMLSAIVGGFLSVLVVLVRNAVGNRRQVAVDSASAGV